MNGIKSLTAEQLGVLNILDDPERCFRDAMTVRTLINWKHRTRTQTKTFEKILNQLFELGLVFRKPPEMSESAPSYRPTDLGYVVVKLEGKIPISAVETIEQDCVSAKALQLEIIHTQPTPPNPPQENDSIYR